MQAAPMEEPERYRRPSAADIFLSFEGRLDRERWLGGVALLVLVVTGTFLATWRLAEAGLIGGTAREALRVFVQVFVLVPWTAMDWKRFHDLGHPGPLALICPGLYAGSRAWDTAVPAGLPGHEAVSAALSWLQVAVALWLAYALAYLAGSPEPNPYGAPPGPPSAPETP
ncbi:DUF805 domain-containing protein [Salinarimonas soli]|uniref:DUF805 domain-containing protein n=1 Tax=Salinarimonas soli TaxID=1638099 RepID=A0A5B2VZU7_9HYPH|nr:DUF805 domain-containing protein [Salinarimonas soli]KAA2244354.1 DUF805 domain-containing protein [Salinarimonas soli]